MPAPPQPVSPRIDDPMALLRACHDKVRHFSMLAQRVQTHVQQHGPDAQARDAAQAVLRYFKLAAPLHHADEEVNLFPALLALVDAGDAGDARDSSQATLAQTAARLQAEHAELDLMWAALADALAQVVHGQDWPAPGPDAAEFARRQQAHAQEEEDLLYPHASRLSAHTLRQLADAMVARRTS